jgi:hypothetical protein
MVGAHTCGPTLAEQKKGWPEATQITGVIRRYDNQTAGSYTKGECHIGTKVLVNKLGRLAAVTGD